MKKERVVTTEEGRDEIEKQEEKGEETGGGNLKGREKSKGGR